MNATWLYIASSSSHGIMTFCLLSVGAWPEVGIDVTCCGWIGPVQVSPDTAWVLSGNSCQYRPISSALKTSQGLNRLRSGIKTVSSIHHTHLCPLQYFPIDTFGNECCALLSNERAIHLSNSIDHNPSRPLLTSSALPFRISSLIITHPAVQFFCCDC